MLGERWTLVIVRELVCGSTRFNQIRRGVPLMSPSLLSKRLKTLERSGIVERHESDADVEYLLTAAGEELRPVVEAVGVWGQRWARGQVRAEHLDASLLMWDVHRNVISDALPAGRTVVHFDVAGSTDGKSQFWLVLERGAIDICLVDPGHEIHLEVACHVRSLVHYWMGDIGIDELVRDQAINLSGPRQLVRGFPTWFTRSAFAEVKRAS